MIYAVAARTACLKLGLWDFYASSDRGHSMNEAKQKGKTVSYLKIINNSYQQHAMCDSILSKEEAYGAWSWWKMGFYLVVLILLVLPLSLSLVWTRTEESSLHLLWSPWLTWSDSPSYFSLPDKFLPNLHTGSDLCWVCCRTSAITICMAKS